MPLILDALGEAFVKSSLQDLNPLVQAVERAFDLREPLGDTQDEPRAQVGALSSVVAAASAPAPVTARTKAKKA